MANSIKIDPPNERQKLFLKSKKRYIAYGGARGGGKSWALRIKAILLCLKYPGIRILLVRRTYRELKENHIVNFMQIIPNEIASYNGSDYIFNFKNGSKIILGYCDNENDVLRYQGIEYDVIMLDEATQLSEFQFSILSAGVRGVNSFPKRMYLTCNPGGVGHAWVKRLFIDRDYRDNENPDDYEFIPAKVFDNKALMKANPEYIKFLDNLPPELRAAWRDGDWDIFAGQYFPEFKRDIHVVENPQLQPHWRRYFAMDYGLDMLAGYYIAVDDQGRAIVYKEIYKSGLIVSEAAKLIKSTTNEDIYAYYAPPDLWNRRQETGKSVAEIFYEHGIKLEKANNDRIHGWMGLKEWLRIYDDEQGIPTANLRISSVCKNLIRCLPLMQHDEKNPNDCATEPHEITHAPDAIRYFIAGRPSPYVAPPKEPTYNWEFEKPKPDALRGERNVI